MISLIKDIRSKLAVIQYDDKICHPECLKRNSKSYKWITKSKYRWYHGHRENGHCKLFKDELEEKSKGSKKRIRCYSCLKSTGDIR